MTKMDHVITVGDVVHIGYGIAAVVGPLAAIIVILYIAASRFKH